MPLNIPGVPSITNLSPAGFRLTTAFDGNPSGTFYAMRVQSGATVQWIALDGLLQSSQTYLPFNMVNAVGTTEGITYTVSVSAAVDATGTDATPYGPGVLVLIPFSLSIPGQPFTSKQQLIIQKSRELMPLMFQQNVSDEQILAYAEVILSDINVWPPLTGFTTETVPDVVLPILFFGISMFSALFLQMNATLQDFTYNDNGLTVQVDQVGKIQQSYINLLEVYRMMITNFKKTQIFAVGGKGLGTPRYQSQIGQFLKISLGSAFTWNSP